ncbi:MAG TPA: aldehyde-activating protein, partial [Candidatus Polarisedimenticolia bacterium]|nr:aldehyde-activating protein [Candidatus Polarisedimenticolia bacterium]
MSKKITGGCACGAVHYEIGAEPVFMLNCHCRDCQRATGAAYAPV